MLTREHAIAAYEDGRVMPDRLDRRRHIQYRSYAERMLSIYRRGFGRTRRELHAAVREVFAREQDCPLRRIAAFCKLLDDAGEYDDDRRGEAAELRRQVFRLAARSHPLVAAADRLFAKDEGQVKAEIAAVLGLSWSDSDARLFADISECHRLKEFAGFVDAAALLARYNVAQVQAALFDAVEMTVWARDDFKTILRYAKLARLLHTIRLEGADGYVFRFDGPASLLRSTHRYGAALARFLPALVACRSWRMHAVVRRRGWAHRLELSPADGLTSHLPPPDEFDSSLEQTFAERWGDGPREGWTLVREGEVLHHEQRVFVPDFVLRHADGRRVLLEIVGFWTPEYLQAKLKTLRLFRERQVVIALAATPRQAAFDAEFAAAGQLIRFKSSLTVKAVLEHLRLMILPPIE